MSIASEIQRLSGVRSDIFTSITNKGVTVPVGSTFSSCPSLIDQIQGGGGGPATSMINSGFTASGYVSGYRPFTATQNEVPVYNYITYTGNIPSYQDANFTLNDYKTTADSPQTATFSGTIQQWALISDTTGTLGANGTTAIYGTWLIQQQSQTDINFIFNITAYPVDTNQFKCNNMNWGWGITSVSPYTASYREQTGTEVPYPTYPTTTTGYIINAYSGGEYWNNLLNTFYIPKINISGYKNVSYDNSPEGGIDVTTSSTNITSFRFDANGGGMLKSTLTSFADPDDFEVLGSTAYTYNYGKMVTAYSGFEGI